MKKIGIWLLTLWLLVGLTACGKKDDTNSGTGTTAADGTKLGLGCVAERVMEGEDKTHLKMTAAAVVLDKDGKIRDCRLDETEFTVTLTDGKPQEATALTSKYEQGDMYVLTDRDTGGAESLKNSWKEQVHAFEIYVKGKTAGEVSGLAVTDGKNPEITGCELVITDFIEAVRKAADAAQDADVGTGDTLNLSLTTTKNGESTDEAPQYDTELAAVTLKDGKITGCMTDTLQGKMTVENGKFTTVSGAIETKRDMGDAYGMKDASSLKKEWYEQADAFDRYCVGKTATELEGAKPDATGKLDGISGCTISVSGLWKNVVKAAKEEA